MMKFVNFFTKGRFLTGICVVVSNKSTLEILMIMLYFPYGLSNSCIQFYQKNNNSKKKHFFPIPVLSFSILSLLFHISFIYPVPLPPLFSIFPRSFLSFRPIPVFSLLVPTSKSSHHFSLFCTLSPQVLRNFLYHTFLILPVVSGFFDSLPCVLLVPVNQLYIHPSSFCS
jgi:hypothetical protein